MNSSLQLCLLVTKLALILVGTMQFYLVSLFGAVIASSSRALNSNFPGSIISEDRFRNEPFHDQPDEDLVSYDTVSSVPKFRSILRLLKQQSCANGTHYCNVTCSHGKVIEKKTGCCKCTCPIGYILKADALHCDKVSWDTWSSWSKCISSAWGGLQQRGRTCMTNHGIVASGRCNGAGSEGRTCSPVTKQFRIRKNIRHLTNEELHDLIQAMTKFKKDNTTDGYMYIAKWHGWPYECPWNKKYYGHSDGHCSWHAHPMFITWHRLITIQFELGLQKHLKNKYLGIPYWDWTEKGWSHFPYLVSKPRIFDPVLQRYVKNPFYRTFLPDHPLYHNKTLHIFRIPKMEGISWYKLLLRGLIRSMNMPTYEGMDFLFECVHNQIHNCICDNAARQEDCFYSMATTSFASFDPIFLLHHSQIDRIYTMYKELHDDAGDQDWTNSSFIEGYAKVVKKGSILRTEVAHSFDFPQSPFCNSSMNTNPVTLNDGVWTVRNAFYGKQLFGYVYDSLDLGGHNWHGLVADIKAKQASSLFGLNLPFVSFAAPNLGTITSRNTHFNLSGCTVPRH